MSERERQTDRQTETEKETEKQRDRERIARNPQDIRKPLQLGVRGQLVTQVNVRSAGDSKESKQERRGR